MPSDAWPNKPPNKSLESTKETFKKRLDGILYEELNVENIEYFAGDALNKTIKLTDDILKEYKDNPNFHTNPNLSTHEQEDEAFKTLELPNIQEILQSIIYKKEQIDSIKEFLEIRVETSNEVITPPQENDTVILAGKGNFEKEKRLFPRLLTLMYILEYDFEIQKETVKITEGKVTPEMMRRTPYVRVEIPDLERTVYICDEEGNASYIFDSVKLAENGLSIEEIDLYDKEEKNSLIAKYPGIGARFIQSKNWRNVVKKILKEIPQNEKEAKEVLEEKTEKKSEFREKRKFLSFEDFQREARKLYPKKGSVPSWYREEKKKHPNWPSDPYKTYKNKGWIGFPELVGIENRLKKERLSFEDFQSEVRMLFSGKGDILRWYHQERKKHPNWPSNPDKMYREWTSWPELGGKGKKEFLPFDIFQKEVRGLYPGGNINKWYDEENKKHPSWPSSPEQTYKDWTGWFELIGAKRKEWLSFEAFQAEVKMLHPGKGGVLTWYREEKKKHPNWPSRPWEAYENKGWTSWPALVGIENRLKKK